MTMQKHPDCERVLFTAEEIKEKVGEVARRLDEDYKAVTPLVICILKGSCVFFADLIRAMQISVALDFMKVSSYGNAATSGTLRVQQDLCGSPADKDVLIVEDIVDSGKTLRFLTDYLLERGAHTVRTVTLLDKPDGRTTRFQPDYKCFDVENEFVVGYGLDYAEKYRNLPYVAVLKREIYE